ncbi:hypothetical protein L7F22_023389 [Adiantum nelumboides]|nr:hypothetical protein [Adiantum nelumboides]
MSIMQTIAIGVYMLRCQHPYHPLCFVTACKSTAQCLFHGCEEPLNDALKLLAPEEANMDEHVGKEKDPMEGIFGSLVDGIDVDLLILDVCGEILGRRKKRSNTEERTTAKKKAKVASEPPEPTPGARGKCYILTAIDYLSSWAEAKPVKQITSKDVAKFVYEDICCKFGMPLELLSDKGPGFRGELVDYLCEKLHVHRRFTTPYYPQCNGMNERFPNGTYQFIDLKGTPHKARVNGYRLEKYYARLMVVIEDEPSFGKNADIVADHEVKMKISSFALHSSKMMNMDAHVSFWMWVAVWSSCMVMMAYSGPVSASDDHIVQGDVMGYWETRLDGTVMPTGLRALVSPLSSSEATQFVTDIDKYLPARAAAFCKSAHLKCTAQGGLHISEGSQRHMHIDKDPVTSRDHERSLDIKKPDGNSSPQGAPRFLDLYSYQGAGLETFESQTSVQENTIKARLLTSSHVHEFSNAFFLEQQVFVRGSVIHVKSSKDNAGASTSSTGERAFLPRNLAKLFPIAGTDGTKIASMLGISKQDLQETLEFCKGKHAADEACFTSMEDVADFVWSVAGRGSRKGLQVYDSVSNASEVTNMGTYFVVEDVKVLKGELDEPSVSCHDLDFPFRVFYCHTTNQTRMFEVSVRGEDGSVYEQTVVCHYDTSYWNPNHFAMVLLHVKPGESEVCHFMGTSWLQPTGWIFVRGATAAAI